MTPKKRPRGRPPKPRSGAANKSSQMELAIADRPAAPSTTPAPTVLRHLAPATASEVYESYWRFAAERQAVFFRRVAPREASLDGEFGTGDL